MKPAFAKASDSAALEDLGRATLRIVHDLKNQLNGLKLYATYLRKCLERDNNSPEESETIAKLIAGLDRAARDLTALVRYAQPLELRCQAQTDLRKIILSAARDAARQGNVPGGTLRCDIPDDYLMGEFDSHFLAEALGALTHEALSRAAPNEPHAVSLHAERAETTSEVLIEWRGLRPRAQTSGSRDFNNTGSVYAAFAKKVIEAHDGRLDFTGDTIRVSLPLSK